MSEKRFPVDLQINAEDFMACEWNDILSGASREGYSSMWQAFSSGARKAMEENRQAHGKVLWLLGDACSMKLSPNSTNEPFSPIMVMEGWRSAIPDDLSDDDILFFSQIVDQIDDPLLKARLADLVWLKRRDLGIKFALIAIDAYRSINLDTESWMSSGRECWGRGLSLARMLRGGAGDRLKEMESAIVAKFDAATENEGFLSLWLSNLLNEYGLGRSKSIHIAQKLESLAEQFDTLGDLHRAREYYEASLNWFGISGDTAKSAEMTMRVAEGWVKEAIAKISTDQPSHMVAASFYENAIQVYRTIPRSERAVYRVDERIAELRAHLNESGGKSLEEMGLITTPGIDISEMVEHARSAVKSKTPQDALKAFANLYQGVRAKQIREDAIERLRNHPLQALFPATVMSRDGRVIAKRPGMSFGGESSDDEAVIHSEMVRDYGILVGIVIRGDIWPALEVIQMEHRLRESDFVGLAMQSPIVPRGREGLFGKALFAGYDRDFVTALHLLVPQIEHMVRFHLKAAGAKTTNLDINGIENENGLSTLMDLPETIRVFGEDLSFEIKTLFCDPFGPNLRNELAHGLITEEDCHSIYAIYAWWLALKLVFNTFWNAARREEQETNEESENGQAPEN